MARPRKPWFRKSNKRWYVEIHGKQVNLGRNKKEAHQLFHRLMAEPKRVAVSSESVVVLIDLYLDWCQKHRAAETFRWYFDLLQKFVRTIDPDLRTADTRPYHVQQWVDSQTHWKDGSKRNAIASVKRVFKWAMEQGYIETNPIALMKKPQCGKKELLVPEDHYKRMLEDCRDDDFKDLLTVHWETGCRPQESLRVEAVHVDLSNQRWVIPTTPGKPDNRVIYLTDDAFNITKKRMFRFPDGPLFRNTYGGAWTTDAVNCRFHRMVPKFNERYSLYAFRHTWVTRMLESGMDSLTVAILAGHKDPSMLAKYYAHLSLNPKHMLEQVKNSAG